MMELNVKKGITRLFFIGLIISVIVGFARLNQDALKYKNNFYYESRMTLERELTDPKCQDILKSNNEGTDPDLLKYDGRCFHLGFFWKTIKDRQIKTETQTINEDFALDAVKKQELYENREWLILDIALYVIGYVLLCFLAWLIFIALRWVKRGFSS